MIVEHTRVAVLVEVSSADGSASAVRGETN